MGQFQQQSREIYYHLESYFTLLLLYIAIYLKMLCLNNPWAELCHSKNFIQAECADVCFTYEQAELFDDLYACLFCCNSLLYIYSSPKVQKISN